MDQARDFYCYEHRRASDGRVFYIGKGKGRRAWCRKDRNTYWHNTVAKHGLIVEVLEDASGLTEEEAHRVERELIAHHRYHQGHERHHDQRSLDCVLTNLTDGGEGASGCIPSEETRAKMSEAASNRSSEYRARMSEALQGERNPNWGKTASEDARRRRSESMRGEKGPQWGRTHSAETRAKLSVAASNRSAETRARMSEARRGKYSGESSSNYNPEPLLFEHIATGERFKLTRRQAVERLGIRASYISDLIAGRKRTAKSYRLVQE